MKLENVKVGTKVRVKTEMHEYTLSFFPRHRGSVGTIKTKPDTGGDVIVEFSDGAQDIGHYSNLKRIKENHS